MTRRVITATPEISVEDAIRLMVRHGVSGLPVVDGRPTADMASDHYFVLAVFELPQ
jgi:CBS-domain-containing membrane protein